MRHGKSDWSDSSLDDFDRPLSQRGKVFTRRMGEWLREHDFLPDCILTSTAKRARKTAKYLVEAADLNNIIIEPDDSLYTSLADHILTVVNSGNNEHQNLLLIGHDSGMEDLVLELAGGSVTIPANGKIMPTSSIAIFEYPGKKWHKLEQSNVKLVDVIRPREIDQATSV